MSDKLPVGILKATPDCFVVQELVGNPARPVPLSDDTFIKEWDRSPVTIFQMVKKGWETMSAVEQVARQLRVPSASISFQGLKDRHAHTSQLIGVQGQYRPSFTHDSIALAQVGTQPVPLKRGGARGNRFTIYIFSDAPEINLDAARKAPNLFGSQRFGREGTYELGRLLLEGKHEEAIKSLEDCRDRKFLNAKRLAGGSASAALSHPEFKFSFQFNIQKWQSHLWNCLVKEKLGKDDLPFKLPMWNPEVCEMYKHLWNYDGPFDPKALEGLDPQSRKTVIEPKNLQATHVALGWKLMFDLSPGAYATVVLSQLFQLEESRGV